MLFTVYITKLLTSPSPFEGRRSICLAFVSSRKPTNLERNRIVSSFSQLQPKHEFGFWHHRNTWIGLFFSTISITIFCCSFDQSHIMNRAICILEFIRTVHCTVHTSMWQSMKFYRFLPLTILIWSIRWALTSNTFTPSLCIGGVAKVKCLLIFGFLFQWCSISVHHISGCLRISPHIGKEEVDPYMILYLIDYSHFYAHSNKMTAFHFCVPDLISSSWWYHESNGKYKFFSISHKLIMNISIFRLTRTVWQYFALYKMNFVW